MVSTRNFRARDLIQKPLILFGFLDVDPTTSNPTSERKRQGVLNQILILQISRAHGGLNFQLLADSCDGAFSAVQLFRQLASLLYEAYDLQ